MIREEFSFADISEYLYDNNELLIVGTPSEDERSQFFYNEWYKRNKAILILSKTQDEHLQFKYLENNKCIFENSIDLCSATPFLLRDLHVDQKHVLLDMSSLDHALIMYLTKLLLTHVVPKTLFASYIRPERYNKQYGDIEFSLSSQVMAVQAVTGFIRRESKNQTLCSFLGFEGIRLKGILEAVHNCDRFVPVVAFPSGSPQWYNTTIWNSMDTLQSDCKGSTILKCLSESVFEAVELLRKNIQPSEKLVLAPIGTRPHSMACAIFACEHPNARMIYDHVKEQSHRAIGVSEITIYHLSSFLRN